MVYESKGRVAHEHRTSSALANDTSFRVSVIITVVTKVVEVILLFRLVK